MLLLVSFIIGSVTSVHGIASNNLASVNCYVCQWSGKSNYASPMLQSCRLEDIAKNNGRYVQSCIPGFGCAVNELYEGTTLIGVSRSCSSVTSNTRQEIRICRGGDCSATATGAGTTLAGNTGDAVPCRTVLPGASESDISTTAATTCSLDTANTLVYCTRNKTMTDIVVDGFPAVFNSPSYQLGCMNVPRTFWTAPEYTAKLTTCVNSFCNNTARLQVSIFTLVAALLTKYLV